MNSVLFKIRKNSSENPPKIRNLLNPPKKFVWIKKTPEPLDLHKKNTTLLYLTN